MRAMVLRRCVSLEATASPLELNDLPVPTPAPGQVLIRVSACGVCHTEIDEIEGRTAPPGLPLVLGHQVVGTVEGCGSGVARFRPGDRVGVGWIYSACGKCRFCLEGRENLCAHFRATGRDADGGYAEYMVVSEDFAYAIPAGFSDVEAAPLLCAGAIGFRSLRLSGLKDGDTLGLTGFGASAHLVLKMVKHVYPRSRVFVFARSVKERTFAQELGAVWAGEAGEEPPQKVDAIIDTTPAWRPMIDSLRHLVPGGRLVINAIRKEDGDKTSLLLCDYASDIWMEKEIKSVANVARHDVSDFLRLAAEIPIKPETEVLALEEANRALVDLKQRKIRGAKVLRIG